MKTQRINCLVMMATVLSSFGFYLNYLGNICFFKGDLINIPVLMIKKHDGDIIKEFLLSENITLSTSVSVSVNFELVLFIKKKKLIVFHKIE